MLSHYNENQNYLVTGKSFNEIRDGLQRERHAGDNIVHSYGNEVWVSGTTAAAYTPVKLGSLTSTDEDGNVLYGGFVFQAQTPENGGQFAVLQECGVSGFVTRACNQGICRAVVNITNATHTHATVEGGTLTSADGGSAKILWKSGNSGVCNCLIDIQQGGVKVGPSLANAIEADGGVLESKVMSSTYTKTVTMAVGQYRRISGSTETPRPFVRQGEAEIKTNIGYFTPYAQVDFSTNASQTMVALESQRPPTSGSGLAYINGSAYSIPVQYYATIETNVGFGLPYFNQGVLSYAVMSGDGIMCKRANDTAYLHNVSTASMVVKNLTGDMANNTVQDTTRLAIPNNALGQWGYYQPPNTYQGILTASTNSMECVDMYHEDHDTIPVFRRGNNYISPWGEKIYGKQVGFIYWSNSGDLRHTAIGPGIDDRISQIVIVDGAGSVTSVGANANSSLMCLCSQNGTFTYRTYH